MDNGNNTGNTQTLMAYTQELNHLPSMYVSSLGSMVKCLLPLLLDQVYVMGTIPTALQGRTADAPILQLTRLTRFTIMGLTARRSTE